MLVEKSLKEALKYFINGKPVAVLYIGEDGGMDARRLEDVLKQKENHFLVDVPAIENPEFAKALADMVEAGKKQKPVQDIKDLPDDEPEEDPDQEPEKKSADVEEHADPGKACPPLQKPEDRMEEKEVDLPANDTENRKTQIISLLELGFCNREVAEQTGIPMGTVSYYAAAWRKKHKGEKLKKSKKEKQRAESAKESPKVDNSDRHLCKSCKFRSNRPEVNNCDYVAITKHSRGCKVEECTKYEKGNRVRAKDVEE